jgi:hypothetical protein
MQKIKIVTTFVVVYYDSSKKILPHAPRIGVVVHLPQEMFSSSVPGVA